MSSKYYENAFNRLDSGDISWNWNAFFFGPWWLAYRKMYAYSFIAGVLMYLLPLALHFIPSSFGPSFILERIPKEYFLVTLFCSWGSIANIFSFILSVFIGLFGNALYYRIVKKRVKKGYHLIKNFQPTSVGCGILGGVFLSGLYFFIDDFLLRKHFQMSGGSIQSSSSFEVSQRNIEAYLQESRDTHPIARMMDISILLLLISLSVIIARTEVSRIFEKDDISKNQTPNAVINGISDDLKYLLPNDLVSLDDVRVLNIVKLKNIPEDFGKLRKLSVLNITRTPLDSLPASFANLESLEVLNISNCKLRTLPESFCNLINLKVLNISGCFLDSLPNSIGNLKNLGALCLSHNKLTEIPESIGNLSSLKKLDLSHNNIKKLPKSLFKLPKLEELDLTGNPLEEKKFPAGLKIKF